MTVRITSVGDTHFVRAQEIPPHLPKVHASSKSDGKLTVGGDGIPADSVVSCALTLVGADPIGKGVEFTSTMMRFGTAKSDGSWSVDFRIHQQPENQQRVYIIAAHRGSEPPDYVEATVKFGSQGTIRSPRNILAFTGYWFYPAQISATGTVFSENNPVTCSLTQVNCLTGAPFSGGQSRQTQQGTFDPDGINWSVAFSALPPQSPPRLYTLGTCFLIEATAAAEGTVYVQGTVGPEGG
jgi:hypothetical protein